MAWRPLHLSASAGAHLPPLLISADLTTNGFTINLSDLTSIWTECLDHDAVIRRSREEVTSIDPNDSDQFEIFREKLKLGLEGGKGTTLALTIQTDADRPSLVLNVSVDLPGGLAPLEWPIRLSAAPQTVLTSQLITPLLRAQHERMQEVAILGEMLKEKDHVIQKLLDKLESQGTELGQVFPQVGVKVGRKVDRKKAAERVKGLAPVDLGAWRGGLSHDGLPDTIQLIGEVFEKADDLPLQPGEPSSEEDADPWWENIKGITVNLNTGKISTKPPSKGTKKTPPPSKPKPALKKQESTDDDDDFQVQATPPRSSATKKTSPPKAALDDTTDDEDDDLDGPSQRSKIPDSFPKSPSPRPKAPSPKPTKKTLGKIGGGKKAAPKPSPPPVQAADATTDDEDDEEPIPYSKPIKKTPQNTSILCDDASETESEFESEPLPRKAASKARSPTSEAAPKPEEKVSTLGKIGGKKEVTPPPPPADQETDDESEVPAEPEATPPPKASPPSAAATKPKPKLGKIGGKKKAAESTPTPKLTESSAASPAPKAGVKRKLGQIGGNKSSPSKPSAVKQESSSQTAGDDSLNRGRATEKEETPPPRETSEERATKKREQLARELAAKASKAPVKNKRKF
ncbi:XLF-domain-containing protein [Acephala macrosclerotiorum]|nr:XLF-domain-containing protein [Acephala macrosclerotiorum]